jgi:hypothetical protein
MRSGISTSKLAAFWRDRDRDLRDIGWIERKILSGLGNSDTLFLPECGGGHLICHPVGQL